MKVKFKPEIVESVLRHCVYGNDFYTAPEAQFGYSKEFVLKHWDVVREGHRYKLMGKYPEKYRGWGIGLNDVVLVEEFVLPPELFEL